ncbi:alpha/beta hydrolase [Thalassotalea castellviae]|uniref:Alpha/beta hydrolase n=1 Tax=Thalassotalea castellviae TaxID=3075612 RepID=A0ABU3A558_9GAMM|nr:alpha/beta hydrolase [Thalassotalea sp. W431]MDT0604955.1 alpha/beta hydrolase [Thalassotalea sp. W431]
MKLLCSVILLFFLSSCGSSTSTSETESEQPEAAYPHASFYVKVAQPVSFSDITSLAYQPSTETLFYGEKAQQYVEYWPAEASDKEEELPALIFIHGGCWSNAYRIEQSYPIATAMALNGFHLWSVEYRATGDQGGGWPGTYQDIELALHFIFSTSENYHSNRKFVVLGHSAGGHLALLASSNLESEFNTVGLAAITDLVSYANEEGSCNSAATSFMNGLPADIPQQYALANPQLSRLADEVFLFIGDTDPIVDTTQAVNSGLPFEISAGTGHFDWIHPGTQSFESLLHYLLNP